MMVAHISSGMVKSGTLFALDSLTSGSFNKSTASDIDIYDSDRTVGGKDIENGTISSSDESTELSLSLEEIVRKTATFRENKLYALLLRPETIDLFEMISVEDDSEVHKDMAATIFQSNEHLFTFAEL